MRREGMRDQRRQRGRDGGKSTCRICSALEEEEAEGLKREAVKLSRRFFI